MTNLKKIIEDWKEQKVKISPLPWTLDSYPSDPGMARIISKTKDGFIDSLTNDTSSECDAGLRIDDAEFIAAAPQTIEVLVQALEEAVEVINNFYTGDCIEIEAKYKWLKKWGME